MHHRHHRRLLALRHAVRLLAEEAAGVVEVLLPEVAPPHQLVRDLTLQLLMIMERENFPECLL